MRHTSRQTETSCLQRVGVKALGFDTGNALLQAQNNDKLIRVFTFGRFGIVRGGCSSATGRVKVNSRPVQLLKCLICLGGREISQARLAEALWPEAEGDAARRSLDTTVYRLRKLLGQADALRFEDSTLSLNAEYIWVDVWAVERLLGLLESALAHTDSYIDLAELQTHWQQLKNYYRGPLLREALDESWAFAPRERLHRRVLRVVEQLGEFLERCGENEKAKACYEQGVEWDPTKERFYRRLIRLHKRQGQLQEAKSVYSRCQAALHKLLDLPPSPETCAAYERG